MTALLERLLAEAGIPPRDAGGARTCSWLLVTPRFRASRHVVALVFPRGSSEPSLVLKLPRIAGDASGVARERLLLEALESTPLGHEGSVPRVVAYIEEPSRPVLVQSALHGARLTPERVRDDPDRAVDDVVTWLSGLPVAADGDPDERLRRLVEEPLARFAAVVGGEAVGLVDRTLELVEPLRNAPLPAVVEHGDLSHPNLLVLPGGGVGVVDWELGETSGLPAHDLFYFLNYVAGAVARARTAEERLRALDDALEGRLRWAETALARYTEQLGLHRGQLVPLLVACWSRYTAGLLERLEGRGTAGASAPRTTVAALVRADRHYALWQHTVENAQRYVH